MIGREHIRVTYLEGRADIKGLYNTTPEGEKKGRAI